MSRRRRWETSSARPGHVDSTATWVDGDVVITGLKPAVVEKLAACKYLDPETYPIMLNFVLSEWGSDEQKSERTAEAEASA